MMHVIIVRTISQVIICMTLNISYKYLGPIVLTMLYTSNNISLSRGTYNSGILPFCFNSVYDEE
jgi:hypothetical protein